MIIQKKLSIEYYKNKWKTIQGSKQTPRSMHCMVVFINCMAGKSFRHAVCATEFVERNKCINMQNINY